jgi:hypothetical protein
LLWLGKPEPNYFSRPKNDKNRVEKLLKAELGFTDLQAEEFITIRKNHREIVESLNREIMQLKKEMFEEAMYGNETQISDSLLNLTLEKQYKIERSTYQHFLSLKKICTPEQQDKLFKLMHKLLSPPQPDRMGGPPPLREEKDRRPPPMGN